MELTVGNNNQVPLLCVVLNGCQQFSEQGLGQCGIGQFGMDLDSVFRRVGLIAALEGSEYASQRLSRQFAMSILSVRRFARRRSETDTTNTFLSDKLPFGDSCLSVSALMGGRATEGSGEGKTRSNSRSPRAARERGFRTQGWRSGVDLSTGATTEIGCYGLASVLKVSDDKIDYNRANFVSSCCFLKL